MCFFDWTLECNEDERTNYEKMSKILIIDKYAYWKMQIIYDKQTKVIKNKKMEVWRIR